MMIKKMKMIIKLKILFLLIINKDLKYSPNETKNKFKVLNDEKHKDRYLNSSSKTYKIENKKLIINIEEYDLQEILVLEK